MTHSDAKIKVFRPLGGDGVDINPASGQPLMRDLGERRAGELSRLEAQVKEGFHAFLELADPQSQANLVLMEVLKALETRVEELVAPDPACGSLLKVLEGLGHKVRVGPGIARKKLMQHLGPEAAEVLFPAPRTKGYRGRKKP
jgi:hypothetical protein